MHVRQIDCCGTYCTIIILLMVGALIRSICGRISGKSAELFPSSEIVEVILASTLRQLHSLKKQISRETPTTGNANGADAIESIEKAETPSDTVATRGAPSVISPVEAKENMQGRAVEGQEEEEGGKEEYEEEGDEEWGRGEDEDDEVGMSSRTRSGKRKNGRGKEREKACISYSSFPPISLQQIYEDARQRAPDTAPNFDMSNVSESLTPLSGAPPSDVVKNIQVCRL